jgi:hypothetical protein
MRAEDYPKDIRLDGLPFISRKQLQILIFLWDEDLRPTQQPAVEVQGTGYTRRLLERMRGLGWIHSPSKDRSWWIILPDGIKMLRAIQRRCVPKRSKTMCLECHEHPRMPGKTRPRSYCAACERAYEARRRRHKQKHNLETSSCSRCDAPRQRYPSGHVSAYCVSCLPIVTREQEGARQAKRRAQVDAGESLRCRQCDQPVYVTERYVYSLCEDHQRAKWNSPKNATRSHGERSP